MSLTTNLVPATVYLGMHILDWVVLLVYFLIVLGIGVWSLSKVKDMSDYFMGGRRFGKVFMMFFAFGSGTSSEQAISVVSGTWQAGLAGIWWQFLWLWATPFYWIVAPMLRRMRALTTADFFESRFGTSTATLYSIYGIIISIVFIAGGLFSSGKMINALTGGELHAFAQKMDVQVPKLITDEATGEKSFGSRQLQGYEYAILAVTVLFVLYGMAGGLGAAIVTDFIQGVLTIVFSVLLLPCVFNMIGGFGHLHDNGEVKAGMFDMVASVELATQMSLEPMTWFYVLMLSLTALAGIVVQPHIMGVCGAGRTEFEGRFGFTAGNFLKRFCTIAWTFTGLACIVWYLGADSPLKETNPQLYANIQLRASPEFANLPEERKAELKKIDKDFADELFGQAAHDILPKIAPGLIGLLMASLLAAVMSTSDAQMIVASGLFTENIYKRFIAKNKSQRHYLNVGRLAGLVIVVLAILLQTTFTDVIHALQVIIKTPAAIGISLWFGIVWRRWNSTSVWVSTLVSAATWYFVAWGLVIPFTGISLSPAQIFPESFFNESGRMSDAWQNATYLSFGVVAGIITSLVTSAQSKDKLDHFFSLLHTPITPGEIVESPCTLPAQPAAFIEPIRLGRNIEFPRPTLIGMGGFAAAWVCVAAIIWLTSYLSTAL